MARFDHIIPFIFKWEGGYDNDPDDPGGETKYGIDKRSHPHEDIKSLTKERAATIYRVHYWDGFHCEHMPAPMGEVYFNCCINCGSGRASQFLRIASDTDPARFLDAQDAFYARLAAARPASKKYLKGWLNRTADLRKFLSLPARLAP